MLLFLIFAFCSFLSVLKCFIQIAYSSDVCALAKQKVVVLHHHCGLSDWYQGVPGGGHGPVCLFSITTKQTLVGPGIMA